MTVSYELLNRLKARRDAPRAQIDVQQEYVIVLSENGGETRELVMPRAPRVRMH